MKNVFTVKTLLRTPIKTLMTFLLLAAVSYLLFINIAEHTVLSREMEHARDYYQGTGAVEVEAAPPPNYTYWGYPPAGPYATDFYLYTDEAITNNPYGEEIAEYRYAGLSKADIDALSELPNVTSTYTRYMTAGVSDTLRRMDDRADYYNHTARFIAEVTLVDVARSHPLLLVNSEFIEDTPPVKGSLRGRGFKFNNITLLAGDPDYWAWSTTSDVTAAAFEFSPDNPDNSIVSWEGIDSRLDAVLHYGESVYNEVFDYDFLHSLVPGERYVVIGRVEPLAEPGAGLNYPILSDPATFGTWPQVYPLKGLPDNYLELDEFAPLRELIEITNADLHTFDVVYTEEMNTIMGFAQGNLAINNGRALTDEDTQSDNKVCVMNDTYMAANGLELGDKITLKLGDRLFEQNGALGAVASVPERYADNFTEVEFEIVGSYKDLNTKTQHAANLYWNYSTSTIFVPLSSLPCEVPDDHVVKPGEFTFVIDDPRNISAFLEESKPIIENKLGFTLFFTDGGWSGLEAQFKQASSLATIRLLLLLLSLVAAIGLTVYLFIVRKKKEYAIRRALGTPRWLAGRGIYVPLGIVAILAIASGNFVAFAFAGDTAQKAAALFAEAGMDAASTVPAALVPLCAIGEIVTLALVTALMIRRVGGRPVLELLHSSNKH